MIYSTLVKLDGYMIYLYFLVILSTKKNQPWEIHPGKLFNMVHLKITQPLEKEHHLNHPPP